MLNPFLSDSDISHILFHLGEERHTYFNAMTPPLIQTGNYVFNTVEDLRESNFKGFDFKGYSYGRGHNPTVDIVRKKMAALDGAEDSLIFASGSSAIYACLTSLTQEGDHVICIKNPYNRASQILNHILKPFGVTTTYVDELTSSFANAITPQTKIIYLESPNTWTYQIQDLKAIATLARQHNIITICDNTYCTPLYQRPISLGIDLTIQSGSKYLNGHSDILSGVVSGSQALIKKLYHHCFLNAGNGITPTHAQLLLKGLRTLPQRLQQTRDNTHLILSYLKQHPKIEKVLFPFDDDFPQSHIAKKQMKDAFGLITICIKTNDINNIEHFCNSLKHIKMAFSWGGYESLILPYCSNYKKELLRADNEQHRLVRLYVGIENAQFLIDDLDAALSTIT